MQLSIYKIKKNDLIDIKKIKKDKHTIKTADINFDKLNGCEEGILFYKEENTIQSWIKNINSILKVDTLKDQGELNYRAVLVLKVNGDFFAVSFSRGIYLIQNKYIDYDFGYEAIKYFIDNKNISSYSRTELGENLINIDGRSLENIPPYKISKEEELSALNSISGKNPYIGSITGKNSLSVRIKGDFHDQIISILKYISNVTSSEIKKLNINNNLERIKDSQLIRKLDDYLVKDIQNCVDLYLIDRSLKEKDIKQFNLNFLIQEPESFKGYSFTGINRNNKLFDYINIKYYLESLCNILVVKNKIDDKEYILSKFKRDRIVINSDKPSLEETIYKALLIEYALNNENLNAILINGNWYYLDKDYYNRINKSINECIFYSNNYLSDNISFIDQKKSSPSEADYNRDLADSIDGLVLDRNLYRFDQIKDRTSFMGYSSIEPCDVIKYDEKTNKIYMIHVKINKRGAGISHLSNQAKISTEVILDENLSDDYISFIRTEMKKCIKEKYLNKKPDIIKSELDDKISKYLPEKKHFTRENLVVVLGIIDHRASDKSEKYLTILKMKAISSSMNSIKDRGVDFLIKPIKGIK